MDPTEALRLIAAGTTPCDTCGRVHQPHGGTEHVAPTWADPDDGHPYRRLSPETFAARVLAG